MVSFSTSSMCIFVLIMANHVDSNDVEKVCSYIMEVATQFGNNQIPPEEAGKTVNDAMNNLEEEERGLVQPHLDTLFGEGGDFHKEVIKVMGFAKEQDQLEKTAREALRQEISRQRGRQAMREEILRQEVRGQGRNH